jgi:hypothetical protein
MMRKPITFLLINFFLLFHFLISGRVIAGTGDNVSGWAWSENVGWISFNCYNDYNGDGILEDHCSGSNYGVNLNPLTKVFSGYAWSENIGWISFNRSETGAPPSNDPCPDGSCIAKFDPSTNKVYGWARALAGGTPGSGGWDGWISLRNDSKNYGVWLDTSTSPQEFRGWAWSDMVIGWISFNCKNQNVCSNSNYKVFLTTSLNQPPTVSNTSETQNSCAWGSSPQVAPGLAIILSWVYSDPDGDQQTAYEIWLDDSPSFSDPKFNKVFESGSQAYALNLADDQEGDWLSELAWGTTYYWKVRVKDSAGNWSDWSPIDSFTTPSHSYPYPDFTWYPSIITIGVSVQFINQSECYDTGGTTTCSASTGDSFLWTFEGGNPSSSTLENPTTTFSSFGPHSVTLKVTDSNGFFCEKTKQVNSTYPLPFWKEIPPIFFKMRNFLASLIRFF